MVPSPTPTLTPTPSPTPTPTISPTPTPTLTPIPPILLPPDFASLPPSEKISILQNLIDQLKAQLNQLSGQVVEQPSIPSSCSFFRDLYQGLTGEDVRCLQKYLNSAGFSLTSSGPGSLGNESTYFGLRTKEAVIRWQIANGVLPQSGYFGIISRTKYLEVREK